MSYNYTVYGIRFHSELLLPELVTTVGNPNVFVRYRHNARAAQAQSNGEVTIDVSPGCFLYTVGGLASFTVSEGREVVIEAVPECKEESVRAYFFGSIVGALLYQRQVLVLHASCINTSKGAVLFAGHSGYGKSTLAAALVNRGYQLLSDDITAIELNETGMPFAQPGIPSSRLWADAVEKLGYSLDGARRSRVSFEKHIVPSRLFCANSQPVHAIFFLTPDEIDTIKVESVRGADRMGYIVNGSYLPSYIAALGASESHFTQATALARRVKIVRVKRPADSYLLDKLTDCVESEMLS